MQATELYKFEYTADGIANVYRWTSSGVEVAWNGQTWTPKVIKRSSISIGSGVEQGTCTIDVAGDNPVAMILKLSPPDQPVVVTIYEGDRDTLAFSQLWEGKASKVNSGGASARIPFVDSLNGKRRNIPIGRYSSGCRWALYSPECGVDVAAFTKRGGAVNLARLDRQLTFRRSEQLDAGWAQGGYLLLDGERRFILDQAAGVLDAGSGLYDHTITLARWNSSLLEGATVDLIAGCDKSFSACSDKFANLYRFGGFPMTPGRSPFDRRG